MEPEFDRKRELKRIIRKLSLYKQTISETEDMLVNGEHNVTDTDIKLLCEIVRNVLPKFRELEELVMLHDFDK